MFSGHSWDVIGFLCRMPVDTYPRNDAFEEILDECALVLLLMPL